MIQTYFIPSRSGDLRLEATPEGTCRLTLEDPTPEEIAITERLIWMASQKGWADHESAFLRTKIVKDGDTPRISIPFSAPTDTISRLLLGSRAPAAGVILAVRYTDGSVQATLDGPAEGLALLEEPTLLPSAPTPAAPAPALTVVTTPATPALAVPSSVETVRRTPLQVAVLPRPTLCCPVPSPGPQDRASEVLASFVTPAQWEEWCADGMIHCKGGLTGDTYRVVHRKHPLAQRQGKITWCETRDSVVHCHQTQFPPAEEVLSVVLTLQYGEDYIRNPSGYFGRGRNFPHPLGLGGGDGLASAGFVRGMPTLLPWLSALASLP